MYNGDDQHASEELHHAIGLDATALPAWESLAALQLNMGDVVEAAETYEKLVSASARPVLQLHGHMTCLSIAKAVF